MTLEKNVKNWESIFRIRSDIIKCVQTRRNLSSDYCDSEGVISQNIDLNPLMLPSDFESLLSFKTRPSGLAIIPFTLAAENQSPAGSAARER